jgi:hypothetical protein
MFGFGETKRLEVSAAEAARDLAALALWEMLSDLTQSSPLCASWIDADVYSTPIGAWGWLRGDGSWTEEFGPMPEDKAKIVRGLVDACELWWTDYDTAIPIGEWISLHGPLA